MDKIPYTHIYGFFHQYFWLRQAMPRCFVFPLPVQLHQATLKMDYLQSRAKQAGPVSRWAFVMSSQPQAIHEPPPHTHTQTPSPLQTGVLRG